MATSLHTFTHANNLLRKLRMPRDCISLWPPFLGQIARLFLRGVLGPPRGSIEFFSSEQILEPLMLGDGLEPRLEPSMCNTTAFATF